ncbi:hypothetical protein HN011_006561 [Eciton burchellii]|nr:hypothetical protein HN011_006561 [Eciton burchellii]
MISNEDICMELKFIRNSSPSQKEKIKEFWKFLDTQDDLQPHEGIPEYESPVETESLISSVEELMKEKDIWRKGLRIFQQLGLDKTALATDNRCKFCLVQRTIQYKDLADTVMQSYDELNADMRAFERRQKGNDLCYDLN